MAHSFRGSIKYIDEYRRLHFIPDQSTDEYSTLTDMLTARANGAKLPIYEKKAGTPDAYKVVRINLSKYEKPNIRKYESLVGAQLIVKVEIVCYDHAEYGKGVSLKLLKYPTRIIPAE